MTSKLSWIFFIPLALLATATKICQAIFITDATPTFLGLTSIELSYVAIACVVAILIFSLIFCLIDRKTAPYYNMKRNLVTGIFGALIAITFAFDGANRLFGILETGNIDVLVLIDALLTLFTAVVFVVLALSHLLGNNVSSGLAIFYIVPAIWSGFRLVITFLKFTAVSVTISDVSILAVYILLTLFLFNYAALISFINMRSPVKANFIYGFPTAAMLIAYGANAFCTLSVNGVKFELLENVETIELTFLGFYIITFLVELTVRSLNKEEVKLIKPEDEEPKKIKEEKKLPEKTGRRNIDEDEVVVTGVDPDFGEAPTHSYLETADTSDYLVDVIDDETDEESTDESHFDKESEDFITKANHDYSSETTDESDNEYNERMDAIDKLILEISEEEFK
ncbi:MAG: hypothetical protein KBS62_07045 [Oscillospiraceae bacterium]|nr:hypothetical protein [Candidatus Ruminococcus equi]